MVVRRGRERQAGRQAGRQADRQTGMEGGREIVERSVACVEVFD